MSTTDRRAAIAAALLALACAGPFGPVASRAVAAPAAGSENRHRPPLEAFFGPPDVSAVVLSPSGRSFAVLSRPGDSRRRLVVGESSHPLEAHVVAAFRDGDVAGVRWVNDDRLVYTSTREDEPLGNQLDAGLFAVDKDGTGSRRLVSPSWSPEPQTGTHIVSRVLPANHGLLATVRDGSADVLVERRLYRHAAVYNGYWVDELEGVVPLRLDTRDGSVHELVPGALVGDADEWLADAQGRIRYGVLSHGDQRSVIAAPSDAAAAMTASAWKTLVTGPRYGVDRTQGAFEPLVVGPDGTTYVEAGAGDTSGVYTLGADGHVAEQPLVHVDGFDFDGSLVFDSTRHRLVGVHYLTDASGTVWLDPALKAVQARVDAKLPGLQNLVTPAECGCSPYYVVRASSDRQPVVWFLYDAQADKLVEVGGARPTIDPRDMAATEFLHFKARDGLAIPAWVTRPAGPGPWPTVVLIHGGPWLRGGEWEWSAERQFLASRGYLVVEPEFRGSRGYGVRLYEAGFRQWGRAMQDDIADATRWAEAQGWADPARVCLMGSSYGGYSTLMGLVNDGPLYRCGIAVAAPTDLEAMYDIWWSDYSPGWRDAGLPQMLGSKDKDADALRAASPALHADRIDRPLLLAHGGLDRRVPIEHARRLLSALRSAHQPVTWVEYADEGHGFRRAANAVEFHGRVEAFLAANLGPGAPAPKVVARMPAASAP